LLQTVSNIENVIGTSGADNITGDASANELDAADGDDVLGASEGADTLSGGAGSDTVDYSTLASAQRINVTLQGANETTVQVFGSANDAISNIENVVGTSGDDTITGDAEDNRLEGRDGNDTLLGGAGNDILDGGDGAFIDTVSYLDAAARVVVDLAAGQTTDDGSLGVDTLIGIEDVRGSNFGDDITIATTTENVFAEGGDDLIQMGLGIVNVDGGAGSDTADYSVLSAANAIDVELDGSNTVTLSIAGSTNHSLTQVENIIGGGGNDNLVGDGSANTLDGGAGDDTLQGKGGDDDLIGGAGIDTADYSQSGAGVVIDLDTNSAADDGEGGTDTLSGIENLAGSNFNDVIEVMQVPTCLPVRVVRIR